MKFLFLISFVFLPLFCLAACSGRAGLNLAQYPDPDATKDAFIYCHGYSCSRAMRIGFSQHEWKQISKIFEKKSKTASAERLKIAKAISLMETYTGKLVGTTEDLPKAPLRRKSYYELDCVDETINTTKYLKFLADDNLLKFHTVAAPAFRGLSSGKYPHNTAVIMEVETGEEFVVDSYVYAHAVKPDIRLLSSWKSKRVEDLDKPKESRN